MIDHKILHDLIHLRAESVDYGYNPPVRVALVSGDYEVVIANRRDSAYYRGPWVCHHGKIWPSADGIFEPPYPIRICLELTDLRRYLYGRVDTRDETTQVLLALIDQVIYGKHPQPVFGY